MIYMVLLCDEHLLLSFWLRRLYMKRFSRSNSIMKYYPVGKITENAVCRRVFLTTWHCILSAKLTKPHSFGLFFGDYESLFRLH